MAPQIFVYNTNLYSTQSHFPIIEINDDTIRQLIAAPSYNYNNLHSSTFPKTFYNNMFK